MKHGEKYTYQPLKKVAIEDGDKRGLNVRKTLAMAEISPALPPDLIINEILLRLPVESIGRCRCVSKPWRRSLSSPRFVKEHLKRHVDDPESIIFTTSSDHSPHVATLSSSGGVNDAVSKQVNFPFYKPGTWLESGSSCHGLALFSRVDFKMGKILVNPITLEATEIPDFRSSHDTSGFNAKWSLGYDSVGDDYKIVSISRAQDFNLDYRVDIYSLKMKTWRRLTNSPYDHCPLLLSGNFVNGCIHWPAFERGGGGGAKPFCSRVIAALNLAREEIEEVRFPVGSVMDFSHSTEITVVDGCLAVLVYSYSFVDVWVMKEYGVQDSWIKHGTAHSYLLGAVSVPYELACILREILLRDNNLLCVYDWRNQIYKDMVLEEQRASDQALCLPNMSRNNIRFLLLNCKSTVIVSAILCMVVV